MNGASSMGFHGMNETPRAASEGMRRRFLRASEPLPPGTQPKSMAPPSILLVRRE